MPLAAVIPVKSFVKGKSRLAPYLSEAQRKALNRNMFNHVLKTIGAAKAINEVIVISGDEDALQMAENEGAHAVLEAEQSNLNSALDVARKAAMALDADSLLVLPADLAKLETTDVTALLEAADKFDDKVIVAPDTKHQGTNALLQQPIDAIPFVFGSDSFSAHQREARNSNIDVIVIERPGLAFDVDGPEELKILEDRFLNQES
ncbi:MAG: 2-phospho-L-lactate guanylyltransferase [Rhodospirillaceae bacterium]|nr:2-phospho-L-lactate guanylyltransferase [Rhodospirillaceae bacterium]|tara:strand:+ start:11983 stop:12597 length:615 start_codon:yes stop_codon:yes gene_type:complete